jgi:tRNA 2-thiouridine synthesizing protein A
MRASQPPQHAMPPSQSERPASPEAAARAEPGSPHHVIDARGVSPPLPLLRAHRALRNMEVGQVLKVLTSQPQAVAEFQAMVKHVPGYELLSQQEEAPGEHAILLRRRR